MRRVGGVCKKRKKCIYTFPVAAPFTAYPYIIYSLKLGYKVVKINEIWHFPSNEKYNKTDKSGGLFTDYVNTFLGIKQEASVP